MQGVDLRLLLFALFGLLIVVSLILTASAVTARHWSKLTNNETYRKSIKPICIMALISGIAAGILGFYIL